MDKNLEVIWTPKALERLADIYLYLQLNWSQRVAERFSRTVKSKVDRLSVLPRLGPASESKQGLRKILFTPHNYMLYRIEENYLRILDILSILVKNPNVGKVKSRL